MPGIAIVNLKGGVGKTNLAFSLAGVFAEAEQKVLVCDCDNSGNISSLFCPGHERREESIADIFAGTTIPTVDIIIRTEVGGVDLIPSDMRLRRYNQAVGYQDNPAAFHLRDALTEVDRQYDIILFDCPPEPHLSGLAALLATDGAIVPIVADEASLDNVDVLEHEMEFARRNGNRSLKNLGYVMSNYDGNGAIERTLKDGIYEQYGRRMFETLIPNSNTMKSARAYHQPVTMYRPKSKPAVAMRSLASEIIDRLMEEGSNDVSKRVA